MTAKTVIATRTTGPGRPGEFLRSLAPTRSASTAHPVDTTTA